MNWKQIDDRYQVSDSGDVISLDMVVRGRGGSTYIKKGVVHKGKVDEWGYHRVLLNGKLHLVHKLVATAFVEGCADGLQVNHKNGNKRDNRAVNLEWVTPGENLKHAYRIGLRKRPFGALNGRSKLSELSVIEIRKSLETTKVLAERYGVSQSTIKRVRANKSWKLN